MRATAADGDPGFRYDATFLSLSVGSGQLYKAFQQRRGSAKVCAVSSGAFTP